MNRIKIPGFEQYLHENIMWERTLDFYLQQNAFLKTRLSQVVDGITNKEFVAQAEQFQNKFIHNDESIKDMQVDIEMLQRSLKDGDIMKLEEKTTASKHQKLRNEMNNFEKDFALLKNEFNKYLNSQTEIKP